MISQGMGLLLVKMDVVVMQVNREGRGVEGPARRGKL